jgi:hypothetical protein
MSKRALCIALQLLKSVDISGMLVSHRKRVGHSIEQKVIVEKDPKERDAESIKNELLEAHSIFKYNSSSS